MRLLEYHDGHLPITDIDNQEWIIECNSTISTVHMSNIMQFDKKVRL